MLNDVVLIGRLTKDCEVRKTQGGLSVSPFTLAVDGRNNNTDFLDCVAWRQAADFLGMYGKKGDVVAVHGRLAQDKRDPEHPERYPRVKVQCDTVKLITHARREEPKEEPKDKVYPEYEKWADPVEVNDDELPF